jgi:hypothetical protein
MIKEDDGIFDKQQLIAIRKQAQKALESACAFGCYPTPVQQVMASAKVVVVEENILDEGFINKLRKRAGDTLKRAIDKILGVIDIKARLIYIDHSLHLIKQKFLKLHETAHIFLPWQRDIYSVVEDCKQTISPEVSESFDREANQFASEVLFQLNDFTIRASDQQFGIKVPMTLSKKYGASIYSSVRRYVATNHRSCVVLIIDPPELVLGDGFVANLRRVVTSEEFTKTMGIINWSEQFTPDDEIGAMIPINGRKMSRPRNLPLRDTNGDLHECVAESFTQGYQVFVLIHSVKKLTSKTVLFFND